MKRHLFQKINQVLVLSIALIIFSCKHSNNQTQTNQNDTSSEQEVNIKKSNLSPKPEKFTWDYEMCSYTGTYDANKYTKIQLENTLKYLIQGEGTFKPHSIFTPEDLKNVNKQEAEQKFNESLKALNSLEFVNTPYFNKIKQKRIKEIERLKLLSLLEIESYSNPKILMNDSYSKEQCSEYTNALIAGGDVLLKMRKKMAEESRDEGNTDAWGRYIKEKESGNEMEYARVFVTTFGWWNCVNNSIERVDGNDVNLSGFMKLFDNITTECEEP